MALLIVSNYAVIGIIVGTWLQVYHLEIFIITSPITRTIYLISIVRKRFIKWNVFVGRKPKSPIRPDLSQYKKI